jgi:hypothetical protein
MVLSIGLTNQAGCANWRDRWGYVFPVLVNQNGSVYNQYGNNYIPYNVIVDDDMVLRYSTSGYSENAIRNMLTQITSQMVRIYHGPLPDTSDDVNDYVVDCEILSAGHLLPDTLKIFWNTDGSQSYYESPLTNTQGSFYSGTIPAQPLNTTVWYYLSAEDSLGKDMQNPAMAPDVVHSFNVWETPPTFTPAPTFTPVPTYTPMSTNTPVATYTAMPPTPTPPPGTTFTPTPPPGVTYTPTPNGGDLGVTLTMPSHSYGPGDPCSCTVTISNPGPETYAESMLYVILDIGGAYFFWPSFTDYDFQRINVAVGSYDITVLPEFPWPSGAGSAEGMMWYAGMTNAAGTEAIGTMSTWMFGWHE